MPKIYTVEDSEIVRALEIFNLPVLYGEIEENQTNDNNFFYYKESKLQGGDPKFLIQSMLIIYVSTNQTTLREIEIIEALEGTGLVFKDADYERLRMENTNQFVDIVVFTFNRKMKKRCPIR